MNVTTNISNDQSRLLPAYQVLTGKSAQEVLSKQGGKLAFYVRRELKAIIPVKGSIRENLLNRLRSGQGFKIRDDVKKLVEERIGFRVSTGKRHRGKNSPSAKGRINRRTEEVRMEIGRRESGRGILRVSALYPSNLLPDDMAISRYQTLLSRAQVNVAGILKFAKIEWPGISRQSKRVLQGLLAPRGSAAIATAIQKTEKDIVQYVARKQLEMSLKAVQKMVKAGVV